MRKPSAILSIAFALSWISVLAADLPAADEGKPVTHAAGISERLQNEWSLYVSSSTGAGEPGTLVQCDGTGKTLGSIPLHEAPHGIAPSNGSLFLAIATPYLNGGEILVVDSNGQLSRPKLNQKFPAPIDMAVDPESQDVIVADNDALTISRLSSAKPGEVVPLAKVKLEADYKHFPSMHVTIARDGYLIFSGSDPKGIYRFQPTASLSIGEPLIGESGAVCADPTANRWVALQKKGILVYEKDQQVSAIPVPAGMRPDHYGLLAFAPDGTLLTVMHTGRGTEIVAIDLDTQHFSPLFKWTGPQIRSLAVALRMTEFSGQEPATPPPTIPAPTASNARSTATAPRYAAQHSNLTFHPVVLNGRVHALNTATGELWRSDTSRWTKVNGPIPQEQ